MIHLNTDVSSWTRSIEDVNLNVFGVYQRFSSLLNTDT